MNASEKEQVGFDEVRDYLVSLVLGETIYLDVDDVYVYDSQGRGDRLVCVLYVEYNSTHFLNVNQALIQAGQVEIKDYDNEFNPNTWSLYISNQAIPEFSPLSFLLLILMVTFMILVFSGKKTMQLKDEAIQE